MDIDKSGEKKTCVKNVTSKFVASANIDSRGKIVVVNVIISTRELSKGGIFGNVQALV